MCLNQSDWILSLSFLSDGAIFSILFSLVSNKFVFEIAGWRDGRWWPRVYVFICILDMLPNFILFISLFILLSNSTKATQLLIVTWCHQNYTLHYIKALISAHGVSYTCILFLCVADPDSEINVMEANERFMDQSEELYSALMDCFFQPPESWDGVTCSVTCYLPEPIYQHEDMDWVYVLLFVHIYYLVVLQRTHY